MKTLYVTLSFACWTIASHAAGFSGIQTVPSWNQSGNLVVEVSNWSKIPVSVSQLTANLPGNGGQSCQWSSNQRIEMGPTQKKVVVLANRTAAQTCLRTRARLRTVNMQAIRFAPVISGDSASLAESAADALTIEARVEHCGQSLRSSSLWSMNPQEQ